MSILCQLNANFGSKGFYIGLTSLPPPFLNNVKNCSAILVGAWVPCVQPWTVFFEEKKHLYFVKWKHTCVDKFLQFLLLSPFFHFGQQNAGYRGSQEEVPITFDFAKRGLTGLCRGERDNDMNIKGQSFGGILAQKRKSSVAVFEKFKTFWHTWLSFK